MSMILDFTRKWNACYRALRYRNGFSFMVCTATPSAIVGTTNSLHTVVGPISRLLATAQVREGDVLLIDWRPGENGLAFLRETEKRSSYPKMPLGVSNSPQLATAEA